MGVEWERLRAHTRGDSTMTELASCGMSAPRQSVMRSSKSFGTSRLQQKITHQKGTRPTIGYQKCCRFSGFTCEQSSQLDVLYNSDLFTSARVCSLRAHATQCPEPRSSNEVFIVRFGLLLGA
eukprot:1595857-Amphidinium_carterae.5